MALIPFRLRLSLPDMRWLAPRKQQIGDRPMFNGSKETMQELEQIHIRVHQALDHLSGQPNCDEAERLMRIVDSKMTNLIRNFLIVRGH